MICEQKIGKKFKKVYPTRFVSTIAYFSVSQTFLIGSRFLNFNKNLVIGLFLLDTKIAIIYSQALFLVTNK